MRFILLIISFLTSHVSAQITLDKLKDAANKAEEVILSVNLSQQEIAQGLKEALIIGATNSVDKASAEGGFNNNKLIKIPFPKDASKMKSVLLRIGMQSEMDKFELVMNEAAEDASNFAIDIFISAVNEMTIKDAASILNGDDNAATIYLKNETEQQLHIKFKPLVSNSIKRVNLARHWRVLSKRYNSVPFTDDIDTDLAGYITDQAIEGLFILIANEEQKIRNNPEARVSKILKKVFK